MKCKNCSLEFDDSHDFCSNCGAKVIRNRLTLKSLFANFSEQFLNYDNKFLQTFLGLFKDPVDVIGGYISGVRKKYVNVVSYFAIAITFSGLQMFILYKYFPEAMDMSAITQPGTEEFQKQNMAFTNEYQSIIMMLSVPVYALMAKLVFLKNKKFNYSELLVVFMYTSGQISIISAALVIPSIFIGVPFLYISMLLLPMQIIYTAYCLKKLYKLRVQQIILKTILFLFVLGVFGFIFTVVILILMYANGTMQELMEAQKAAQQSTSYIASSVMNWTS